MGNKFKYVIPGICLVWVLISCTPAGLPPPATPKAPATIEASPSPASTSTPIPSPTDTLTPTASSTFTSTPLPVVASLAATVTADLLSCRYGPGPFYLFLYGLNHGANITLIGRTDGNNWVWVDGKNKCWVNANYISINGDPHSLPVVYPGIAHLPQSPTYLPTVVTKVVRVGSQVKLTWLEIPLVPGDEESATMQHYIIEVWHCTGGQLVFDPLGTNDSSITFIDEPGCSQPSHGRIFVQEKHGLAGPADIPWPPYTSGTLIITPTP